ENAEITIEPLKSSNLILQPYASYANNNSYNHDSGCTFKNKKEYSFTFSLMQDFSGIPNIYLNEYYLPASGFNFDDSVTASFFEQLGIAANQEMFTISALVPPYFDDSEYTTQTLQAVLAENYVYRDFVYSSYTQLEQSEYLDEVFRSLPAELIETGNKENTAETLNSIRHYLDETCEYTLSPGRTPSTRDFVNYFLLENNAGYCMHYATAGTLLARHFGIPARYCEGYIVSADMMEKGTENDDGSVTITIPDSASHAWCEYYVNGYGWIPFEFTPGYYDNAAPPESQYTETSTTTETSITETTVHTETETSAEITTSVPQQQDMTTSDISDSQSAAKDNSIAVSSSAMKVLSVIIITFIVIAAIAILMIVLRRLSLNRRKQQFNCKDKKNAVICIYNYLCRILMIEGIKPENMQMLDYADHVKILLDTMNLEGNGAKEIILAALAADMGGKTPSDENINAYSAYVSILAEQITKKKPWYKLFIFKYLHHLI
ncbi:MAG: transglutaminase family protein, partial [Oscillospiraceae bacterium]|nr:transglutaminase family protein [Oscillospiraceae bacterium]